MRKDKHSCKKRKHSLPILIQNFELPILKHCSYVLEFLGQQPHVSEEQS